MFDSHVRVLLDVSVSLVNTLTDGQSGGKPYIAPAGALLPEAVRAALPLASAPERVELSQAAYLADAARQMRVVFEAVEAERLHEAAEGINALLVATGARPQLDRVGDEPWQVHFHGSDDSVALGWGAGCATALALALGSDLAGRLGVCRAPRCDRTYVDTSRNGARQFCSTACQSRVKAAAYRARQAEG